MTAPEPAPTALTGRRIAIGCAGDLALEGPLTFVSPRPRPLTKTEIRDAAETLIAISVVALADQRRALGVIVRDAVRTHRVLTLEEAAERTGMTPRDLEELMDEVGR